MPAQSRAADVHRRTAVIRLHLPWSPHRSANGRSLRLAWNPPLLDGPPTRWHPVSPTERSPGWFRRTGKPAVRQAISETSMPSLRARDHRLPRWLTLLRLRARKSLVLGKRVTGMVDLGGSV